MQVRSIPHLVSSLCALIAMLLLTNMAQADLAVDTSLSTTTFGVSGATSTSATSGTLCLQLAPGTAQITDLNLTLDDVFSLSIPNVGVELQADPGSIQFQLINPGPAGNVSGGMFDQLGNIFTASGQAEFSEDFGPGPTVDFA